MKALADVMKSKRFVLSDAERFEYADLVNQIKGFVKQDWIVVHRRIVAGFTDMPTPFMLSCLRKWVHMAGKSTNAGLVFNGEFKKYRIAYGKEKTTNKK